MNLILRDAPPGDPPAAPPAAPWYEGKAQPDEVGYLQARGWDKDPVTAALGAAKAHREAEKMIGIPAAELLRIPKDFATNPAARKTVMSRLGAPAEAKDYDLTGVKNAKNEAPADAVLDVARALASELALPKDDAPILAKAIVKFMDDNGSADLADATTKLEESKAALKKSWGANWDHHMLVAKNAAAALGVSADMVAAFENHVGYDKVMEMFRVIGSKIGEDKFITNDKGGTPTMTPEMAAARIKELKSDTDWTTRYLGGGQKENNEMTNLEKIAYGWV